MQTPHVSHLIRRSGDSSNTMARHTDHSRKARHVDRKEILNSKGQSGTPQETSEEAGKKNGPRRYESPTDDHIKTVHLPQRIKPPP